MFVCYWQMSQASLLSVSQKVEATLEHGIWKGAGVKINSRTETGLTGRRDDEGKDFSIPPDAVLCYWETECCVLLSVLSSCGWRGCHAAQRLGRQLTQPALPVISCSLLSWERKRCWKLRDECEALILSNGNNLLLTPHFSHPLCVLRPSQEYEFTFLQSIWSNLWWQTDSVEGASATPRQDPGSCLATAAAGLLVGLPPAPRGQTLVCFACRAPKGITGADPARNARITKSRGFGC